MVEVIPEEKLICTVKLQKALRSGLVPCVPILMHETRPDANARARVLSYGASSRMPETRQFGQDSAVWSISVLQQAEHRNFLPSVVKDVTRSRRVGNAFLNYGYTYDFMRPSFSTVISR